MAVKVGSARIDENGHATGGAAGDQTGKEVSTQSFYLHSKGWRVLRCKVRAKALMIAAAMKAACANNCIGYDQGQRLTLYNLAKSVAFNPAKVTTKCETDCSALVRVCLAYAGITCGNFRTTTQAKMMLDTGMFVELTDTKYTKNKNGDYLQAGDVLVTKTQGHTVVVLNDGAKANADDAVYTDFTDYELGERILKNGSTGSDVKELQTDLIALGYSCGSWGADGDFGDATEQAVRKFQSEHPPLEVDGEYGPLSHKAMLAALNTLTTPKTPRKVIITGGNCYVRTAPVVKADNKLGVVFEGTELEYQGQTDENGWHLVVYLGQNAWVSGKYGRLME